MRKILFIAILLLSSFAFLACSKFLGNQPKGYTIPQYIQDYAILLNDDMLQFMGVNYPACLTDDIVIGGSTGVPIRASVTSKSEDEIACYTFKEGAVFPNGSNDWFYEEAYKQIYTFNVVINNIMNVPDGTETEKLRLKAEALVHRAYNYLQLVNVYATQYDKNTAAKDLGVPIVLSEDINSTYIRNSVQEVYDLIVTDLKWAVENTPVISANVFHPNKTAIYGILARTHLYMGAFDAALDYAKKALEHNKTAQLINYTKYHDKGTGLGDRIVDENDVAMPVRAESAENIYMRVQPNDMSSSFFAGADLVNSFSHDMPAGSIDKRFEMFYAKDRAHTWEAMEFPGYTMFISHLMPNVGLTLQEIYLLLAECEARSSKGTAEQATAYLDVLRNHRITHNKPLKAISKEDALRMALEERRREMAFWGQMRYIDLKRLNKEERFAKTITHTLDGKTYTLPPNDKRYVMPLPHSVITFNPDIPVYER